MKTSRFGDIAFLQLAIRNEELMALMYDVFRVRVPCSKEFWEILSKEEMDHAERLQWLLVHQPRRHRHRLGQLRDRLCHMP
jgi:hypothetical protein